MAFSYTITKRTLLGPNKVVFGTYNGNSVTTGNIVSGLNQVEAVVFNGTTYSASGGTVTLNFTSGQQGTFLILGH